MKIMRCAGEMLIGTAAAGMGAMGLTKSGALEEALQTNGYLLALSIIAIALGSFMIFSAPYEYLTDGEKRSGKPK